MTPRQWRLLAAAAGAAAGLAGRNSPMALADRLIRSPQVPDCGMEEVLECVFRDGPTLLVGAARWALAAAAIAAGAAALGAVAVVVGLLMGRRVASPLLLGGGVMLVMPALWMAGTAVASLAS